MHAYIYTYIYMWLLGNKMQRKYPKSTGKPDWNILHRLLPERLTPFGVIGAQFRDPPL